MFLFFNALWTTKNGSEEIVHVRKVKTWNNFRAILGRSQSIKVEKRKTCSPTDSCSLMSYVIIDLISRECSIPFTYLFACWEFFHLLSSAFCFLLFSILPSRIPSECQTVGTSIRHDVLSCLILVQSVCKSYQQETPADKELTLA